MANWTLTESAKGELTVTVDGEKWQKAVKKAFNKVASQVQIPGFRKGNVPKSLLEKRVPRASIYEQAIDDNINTWFREALEECKVEPIAKADSDVRSVSEDGVELVFTVKVAPKAKLGDLSEVKYEVTPEEVTEEDINNEIERERGKYAEEEKIDGPAENGDTVKIDYSGKKDGVAFEGGTAFDYDLKLGSGSFIPGFEEGLVGAMKGEERKLELKFPEEYHSEELAGADVVFEVTVNEITRKTLPEVNDEFVEDQSIPNVDTVEQYREHIRTRLSDQAKRNAEASAEQQMMEDFANAVEVEIPAEMIEEEMQQQMQAQASQMQQYGLSLTSYLEMMGMNAESFRESFRENAEKTVKIRLGLKALAEEQGFTANEEDIEKQYQEIADMYQMPIDNVKSYIDPVMLAQDIANQKAVDFLKGNR